MTFQTLVCSSSCMIVEAILNAVCEIQPIQLYTTLISQEKNHKQICAHEEVIHNYINIFNKLKYKQEVRKFLY